MAPPKNNLLTSLGLGTTNTVANVAPMTGGSTYLQDMQKLLSGDLSASLTGGEKLTTLGALLKSAARGSQTSPQEVIAQARQVAQNRAATQMQLAQLQAKAEQEAKQKEFIKQYASVLPEDKRGVLENMDTAEAFKTVSGEAFRPKQVFQTKRDPESGNMRIIFGDGTSQVTDIKLPANTQDRDIGGAIQVVDKDTGEVLQTVAKTMTPVQVANYGLAQKREQRISSQPSGGGGGGGAQYTYMNLMTTGGRMARYAVPKNNPNGPKIFVGFVKDQPLVVGSGVLPPAPK